MYESSERIGGHSNTVLASVDGRSIPVDTGFIVFNRLTYPNLTALFELLEVPTEHSDMSFAASLDDGNLEYSGTGLCGLFAQRRNLFRPRFWSMLADLVRFYREARRGADMLDDERISLGDYLAKAGYGTAFRNDHILPMASAIWCSLPADILAYPAASFIRFHDNHGLLQLRGRPAWETVSGGSRSYVERLIRPFADRIRCDTHPADPRSSILVCSYIWTASKFGCARHVGIGEGRLRIGSGRNDPFLRDPLFQRVVVEPRPQQELLPGSMSTPMRPPQADDARSPLPTPLS